MIKGTINRKMLLEDCCSNSHQTIILIDINNFTYYNEIYGQFVGDLILDNCMQELIDFSQKYDYTTYRISGDIFAIKYQNSYLDEEMLLGHINDLFTTISKIRVKTINDDDPRLDVTLGIAYLQYDVLTKAEIALKHAKENHYKYFTYTASIDSSESHNNVLYWQKELAKSIDKQSIEPYFQAIVDSKKHIIKYEALMRMIQTSFDGTQKIISPIKFLDISKETNQYNEISKIMMNKVFNTMEEINISFSINITFLDIVNKDFINNLKTLVSSYTRKQKSLFTTVNTIYFEIVEDEHIHDYNCLSEFLQYFQFYKVEVAIDDFGSGYSNFMHLLKIQPKFLKLDGTLIKDIDTNKEAKILVKGIVSFAHKLGIKVIAEYVHNEKVFIELKKIGIDQFQGFYFSKPEAFTHKMTDSILVHQ